jgi:hypothetical protein
MVVIQHSKELVEKLALEAGKFNAVYVTLLQINIICMSYLEIVLGQSFS